MATKRARDAQAQATRSALVDAARRLFVAKGYHATGTEEIVAAAGVGTRGALYHHFPDKRALFVAVFEAVEEDLLGSAAGATAGDAFGRLQGALLGFLDASTTKEVQQILLLDGPAVLGWREWRALEERYGLGAIEALVTQAVAEGSIGRQSVTALSHLLLAVIDEAALYVANADDAAQARTRAATALKGLLSGLRSERPRAMAPRRGPKAS